MASSNRHWPSMFKSKPCNSHHQWQHDINQSLISTGCQRPPYSSGCEERSPEPKPRWNPKPEQIRILEAIFNSGMVNPPREEIRKIRAQLQEYGQVGDANVFYWFQNRKSRSKHKLRHIQNSKQNNNSHQQQNSASISSMIPSTITPSSSSSSSSDHKKSSLKVTNINKTFSMAFTNITDVSNSPTASVNQTSLFQNPNPNEFYNEPFVFPVQQPSPGFNCFSHDQLSNINVVHDHVLHEQNVGPCTNLLLSELMNHGTSKRDYDGNKVTRMESQHNYSIISTAPTTYPTVTQTTTSSTAMSQYIQGVGEQEAVGPDGAAKSTVFINDVPFEVVSGPFNVREAFGDEAVLIHSSGQPVLTNDWGVTLQSLQNGAFYYLI